MSLIDLPAKRGDAPTGTGPAKMAPTVIKCWRCKEPLPFSEETRGTQVRCTKCGQESIPYAETMIDVRADRVTLLGGGGGRSSSIERSEVAVHAGAGAPAPESTEPLTDDDIPF